MSLTANTIEQMQVCQNFGADFSGVELDEKIGVAENVRSALRPVNGLRHVGGNGTTGWYIYAGEVLQQNDDFFQPICARHLNEWRSGLMKYLGLPPGWRFLIADDYEDVWFDPNLLNAN